jgi:diguanylate cyclase (GGDEF)-like protein/PAS domain S-box-containing protein
MQPRNLANVRRFRLERLLDVVRQLGESGELGQMLDQIAAAVVEVVEFGAAAINVVSPQGVVTVASVVGPPEARALLGKTSPVQYWLDILALAEPWGSLRFYSHERDQRIIDRIANWTPAEAPQRGPDAWHPDDSLLAPLWNAEGTLIGVLSVDQPRSGRHPDFEEQTILELFAAQAAKAIIDARARQREQEKRREIEVRWELAFGSSPISSVLLNEDRTASDVNDAFCAMIGYSREELESMSTRRLSHPDDYPADRELFEKLLAGMLDSYEIEKRYIHADGHVVWGRLHTGVVRRADGSILTIIAQITDVTDRKQAEQQLARRASHDPLTDLPNRSMLEERLTACLVAHEPSGVLFCDLDRFKIVNDSLGHDAGDELLVAVARRLHDCLPEGVTLGRVGGDEFVAIAPGVDDLDTLRRIAELMLAVLRRPVPVRGHEHTVSLSIGVTVSGPWHTHADEVLREAGQALLRAKRRGRSRVEVYDARQDRSATVADLELERALRSALSDGRGLIPYFQPIVSLIDDATVGYEALVRWEHPELGTLDPDDFLPQAEEAGLIVPLGWWMLDVSCASAAKLWLRPAHTPWVAVNASGSQLGRGQLPAAVGSALRCADLDPKYLHLEITETVLVDASSAAIAEVLEVAALGVHIALDDFGTGYSSLSLLRDLPVTTVKIDRSFVGPITHDATAIAIVRSVIGLCRELGITTVAEGVETEGQLTTLRALGCNLAQGYLLGSPSPLGSAGEQ